MKTFNKLSIVVILSILFLYGCSIDKIQPINALTEDNVVRDETSAQAMLDGIYVKWRVWYTGGANIFIGILGNAIVQSGGIGGTIGFPENDVMPDNEFVEEYYTEQYAIVNQANWLIESLERGMAIGLSENRKNEMLGEAKCHRAMAHFNLLRLFGQFYDVNSKYGIVIRQEPARGLQTAPRNNVQSSYNSIIDDFKFAAENAPANTPHFRISKTTAMAYLSKVYLYIGDFEKAASMAAAVINSGNGYGLEVEYKDIFLKRHDSRETFFSPFVDGRKETNRFLMQIDRVRYSNKLRQLADDQIPGQGDLNNSGSGYDPRFNYAFSEDTKGVNDNGKYPYVVIDFSASEDVTAGLTNHSLRMAEIYLVFAEAKARLVSGTSTDPDAIEAINIIRKRAGNQLLPVAPTNKKELLDVIRKEKMLELFSENGEPWFDIVRYDRLGDLKASEEKSTLTHPDKFILPIGLNSLEGNKELIPNPGY